MWASGRARAPKTSVGLRTEDRGQPRAGNKEPRVQAPARPTACRAPLRRGPAVTLCVSSLKTSWSQSITRKNRLLGITVPESPRALWVPFLYALEAALPVSSLNVDVPRALRLDLSRLPHGLALAVHNSARGSRTNHTECPPNLFVWPQSLLIYLTACWITYSDVRSSSEEVRLRQAASSGAWRLFPPPLPSDRHSRPLVTPARIQEPSWLSALLAGSAARANFLKHRSD